MELLSREIILTIAVIVVSSSGICRAVDCGGRQISSTIVVGSKSSNFTSIQDAIDSIPRNNSKWVKIQINGGTYKERVSIPVDKACTFIQGQGADVTTITSDDHSATNTSATFTSFSINVVVSEITFQGRSLEEMSGENEEDVGTGEKSEQSWFLLDIVFYSQNLFQKDIFSAIGWIPPAKTMNAIEEVKWYHCVFATSSAFST
ncbi:putative pectinesterase 10 [Vigna radiata var. radiata]|uniref:pectinesterase n=1 Tax=Vigna radiata var. radiata TaxID=3916 RepID=A0A1S3V0T9_VIGRR|nr:putative pectinesterase 10 [Vigna radiata var. radiata]